MLGGCANHENELPCDTVVVKQPDETNTNSTDRLVSALVSDSISVSSPLVSHHSAVSLCPSSNQTSLIDVISESVVTSERISSDSVIQNNQLTVSTSAALHVSLSPCDRLFNIHLLEENAAIKASNDASVCASETRTKPLLEDHCLVDTPSQSDSCTTESSVATELHSLLTDAVSVTSSSTIGIRNRNYIVHSGQLPEINRIHVEAGKSMLEVNSSCCIVEKHYTPTCHVSLPTSLCCVSDCVMPNVTMSTVESSQNGLSVGQVVSCFKSMTDMAKSQKTARHKGELHVFTVQ